MIKIGNIFKFLVDSTIHLGLVAVFMLIFSYSLYGINIDYTMLVAVFCITFTVYCTDRLVSIKEDEISNHSSRTSFISKNKILISILVICALLTSVMLVFLKNPYFVAVILFPPVIGLLYSIKYRNFRLKNITGIKNVTVGLAWATVGALIPLVSSSMITDNPIIVLYVFFFIFITFFTNSTMSDVYDIEGDKKNKVPTIPVKFGKLKTGSILSIMNLILMPITLIISGLLGIFYIPLMFIIMYKLLCNLYIFQYNQPSSIKYEIYSTSEFIYTGIILYLL